uniref:Mitochondrial inner membrane protease subunit 2 n=1 Tax=Geospiza parvula TaxID=87175 RepID=A0A8C3MZK0_GEOPR
MCNLISCLRSPRNPEQKIIKRVIALEGDIIKTIGYKKKYVKVPHGHIWVEGDHHGHSFDSNAFGPVSQFSVCHALQLKNCAYVKHSEYELIVSVVLLFL